MYPIDVLTIETSYLTSEHFLKLFLYSFAYYFESIRDDVRLVLCINSGDDNCADKKLDLLMSVHEICGDYNYLVFECDKPVIDSWRKEHGLNCRPDFVNLSHGHVVHEYLTKHCQGVMFTLLCHSDIEFTGDMSVLANWQKELIECPSKAAINGWDFPEQGRIAESMNLAFSLWKTPILFEYAITKGIELGGVDKRNDGGLFYDTGSWLLEKLKDKYSVTRRDDAPVHHEGGITSMLLSRDDYELLQEKLKKVNKKIDELRCLINSKQ